MPALRLLASFTCTISFFNGYFFAKYSTSSSPAVLASSVRVNLATVKGHRRKAFEERPEEMQKGGKAV